MALIFVRNKAYNVRKKQFEWLMEPYPELLALGPIDGNPPKPGFEIALQDFNERLYTVIQDKKPVKVADISFGGNYTVDPFIETEPNFRLRQANLVHELRRKGDWIFLYFYQVAIGDYFYPYNDKLGLTRLKKLTFNTAIIETTGGVYERGYPQGKTIKILSMKAFRKRRI